MVFMCEYSVSSPKKPYYMHVFLHDCLSQCPYYIRYFIKCPAKIFIQNGGKWSIHRIRKMCPNASQIQFYILLSTQSAAWRFAEWMKNWMNFSRMETPFSKLRGKEKSHLSVLVAKRWGESCDSWMNAKRQPCMKCRSWKGVHTPLWPLVRARHWRASSCCTSFFSPILPLLTSL